MSAIVPVLQPVKVSELLGMPKSSDKHSVSEKKRLEPVKVKDLLVSCSETAPSSEGRVHRRTFLLPKSGKKPVRRALYEKANSPHRSPDRCDASELSKGRTSSKKCPRRARKSCLPPPNSIAQRHIRGVIDGNIRSSATIEKLHEPPPVEYQRKTVIQNTKSRCSQHRGGSGTVNASGTIPSIAITGNKRVTTDLEEVEALIGNNENIPPPSNQMMQSAAEIEVYPAENIHLQPVDSWHRVITRIEKVEHDLDELKAQQAVQIDLLRKIYGLVTLKCDSAKVSLNVEYDSLSPRILSSHRSQATPLQANEENVVSEKMSVIQCHKNLQEHLKSECLVAESLNEESHDSSVLREERNVNDKPTLQESSMTTTPKMKRRSQCLENDRPLREYLVMKAGMSFLETPEPHGFRCKAGLRRSGMSAGNNDLRRSISSRLFDELQDLYLDSPGPTSLYP